MPTFLKRGLGSQEVYNAQRKLLTSAEMIGETENKRFVRGKGILDGETFLSSMSAAETFGCFFM